MTIDIRSDTVTKPSPEMRRAIAEAEVGDDFLDGDPTTRRLEEAVAQLLGKERAIFFPSGTMANQCAIWTLSERGTEIYADYGSHINDWEMVGAAAIAGVQLRTVQGEGPMMDAQSLERAFRAPSSSAPSTISNCISPPSNPVSPLASVASIRNRPAPGNADSRSSEPSLAPREPSPPWKSSNSSPASARPSPGNS